MLDEYRVATGLQSRDIALQQLILQGTSLSPSEDHRRAISAIATIRKGRQDRKPEFEPT